MEATQEKELAPGKPGLDKSTQLLLEMKQPGAWLYAKDSTVQGIASLEGISFRCIIQRASCFVALFNGRHASGMQHESRAERAAQLLKLHPKTVKRLVQ